MDSEFLDDDEFHLKRLEFEKKKQKKLEKQERLKKKSELIQEIKEKLTQNMPQMDTFSNCLTRAQIFQKGSYEWALAFLNCTKKTPLNELKKIYLNYAFHWHPDKNNATSEEEMKLLNEVWRIVRHK